MRRNRLLSIILAVTIVVSVLCSQTAYSAAEDVSCKISNLLSEKINESDQETLIPVYIFLKNCDTSEVNQNLETKHGINPEVFENPDLLFSDIISKIKVDEITLCNLGKSKSDVQSIIDLDNKDSSLDISTRKRINSAINETTNDLLKTYRTEFSNIVGKFIDEFINKNAEYLEDIIFQSDSAEFIVANVKKKNIELIANLSSVTDIDYFNNVELKPASWNATTVTHSDSHTGLGSSAYNDGSGYDGTGVKIGIIEASYGRYDSNNYNLSNANLTYVDTTGVTEVVSNHATNVTALICGKKTTIGSRIYEGTARGADVYQTAIYSVEDVLTAMTVLVNDYNVNIINFSAQAGGEIYYSSFDKAVDNIIKNNKLTFVVAAGNTGTNVTSPGKAYNAITVGNLKTKESNNSALYAPYHLWSKSGWQEADYLTNKPDVIAPGTYLYLPSSAHSVVSIGSGTSYSSPIVAGIAAKIMQSNSIAKFNINSLKSYLLCGADNDFITGINSSYGALMDESGAGLANAVKTFEVAQSGNETYGSWTYNAVAPTPYYDKEEIELYQGERIRIALSFRKPEDIAINSAYGNNIDIRLVEESLEFCEVSESTTNNVEIIDVVAPEDGTYTLQMRLTDSLLESGTNPELRYWVSWRIE